VEIGEDLSMEACVRGGVALASKLRILTGSMNAIPSGRKEKGGRVWGRKGQNMSKLYLSEHRLKEGACVTGVSQEV
jgi:hypothetical protein